MKYTKLGSTGMDVSRVCLGGMSFGRPGTGKHNWVLDDAEARPIIRRAVEAGINFFDTSNNYGEGTSEEILGDALAEYGNRDELVIATKLQRRVRPGPNGMGISRKAIFTDIEHSLRRLKVDYVDLYQIHRWDPDVPIEESLEALHDVVKAGKARYLGASSMKAWQFSKALYTSQRNGWTRFVTMQDHYNLLNREEEQEMYPLCADQGVGVLPWSPLARGRLTREWGTVSARSENDEMATRLYRANDERRDRAVIDAVGQLATARGLSRAQVALAWVMANPLVSAPIVGATKPAHLEDAIAAVEVSLSAEEKAALDAI
jgi:aryl-alcohol dehydrogenase-like predicted oxidoreductase